MILLSDIKIENETDETVTISKKTWNNILSEFAKPQKNISKQNLEQYEGLLSLSKEPLEFQKEMRNEWQ